MTRLLSNCLVVGSLLQSSLIAAINLDVNDPQSIKGAAKTAAKGLMANYNGNEPGQVPGLLPNPDKSAYGYFWWQAGTVMDALINYWARTGDSQFNNLVQQALYFQQGPDHNYEPQNQTYDLCNDDQAAWALAAMTAAERSFPASKGQPAWIDLAVNVFNRILPRWDSKSCGGGLHWQINPFNGGYNYKSTDGNAMFFLLAARLAHYTGNKTYSDAADMTYKWSKDVGLIDKDWHVYDGTDLGDDCHAINKLEWTYNKAAYLYGAAVMDNVTHSSGTWHDDVSSLVRALQPFAPDGVLIETACESRNTCNHDQQAYKGITARWMAAALRMAPFVSDTITEILQKSATAAAGKACTGGTDASTCGFKWTGQLDKVTGMAEEIGPEMNALDVFGALLETKSAPIATQAAPAKASSGNGTSTVQGGSSITGSAMPSSTSSGADMLRFENLEVLCGLAFGVAAWFL